MALDPIPSATGGGRQINRHCVLPAGHDRYHQSRDVHGEPVHAWAWLGESGSGCVVVQDSLF